MECSDLLLSLNCGWLLALWTLRLGKVRVKYVTSSGMEFMTERKQQNVQIASFKKKPPAQISLYDQLEYHFIGILNYIIMFSHV